MIKISVEDIFRSPRPENRRFLRHSDVKIDVGLRIFFLLFEVFLFYTILPIFSPIGPFLAILAGGKFTPPPMLNRLLKYPMLNGVGRGPTRTFLGVT